MEIRKAKLSDAKGLAKLFLLFWDSHKGVNPLLELRKKPTLESETKEAKKYIRKGKPEIFVAVDDDSVIGFIEVSIKKNEPVFKVKKSGYIESLVVDKKCRRAHVGSSLLAYVKALLKKRGVGYITVTVYPSNRLAVEFWKKTGFKDISKIVISEI